MPYIKLESELITKLNECFAEVDKHPKNIYIMTREEMIIKAAFDYHNTPQECAAFVEGAQWADEHLKSPLTSIDDDLPCGDIKLITTEKLRAEIKRRSDELKAEKAKVKRCRMCKHWGEITYWGKPVTDTTITGGSKCCKFFTNKTGKYYRFHAPSQIACEHFEEKDIKL